MDWDSVRSCETSALVIYIMYHSVSVTVAVDFFCVNFGTLCYFTSINPSRVNI